MNRISFAGGMLLAGVAAGIPLGLASSQTMPTLHIDVLLQRVANEIPQPAKLEVRRDRWDAGAETGMHEHPGPAILAVIEGELIEVTPTGRNTLRAGEVYWRQARARHNVRNESGKAARVFAIHFDPVQ